MILNIFVVVVRMEFGVFFQFVVDQIIMRVCILVNGKLRVKVDNEEEYVIEVRGVFKIDVGVGSRVFNWCYEDVVLYVNGFQVL